MYYGRTGKAFQVLLLMKFPVIMRRRRRRISTNTKKKAPTIEVISSTATAFAGGER
jgi:hypothetical protein